MSAGDGDFPADLFRHRYRRRLVYCLFLYATPMRLGDIAHQLTVWERSPGEDDAFIRHRIDVYEALLSEHVPPLDEADVVEYVPDEGVVNMGATGEALEPRIKRRLATEVDDLLEAEEAVADG